MIWSNQLECLLCVGSLLWRIFCSRLIFYALFWIVMFRGFCNQMKFTYSGMQGPRSLMMIWEIGSKGEISTPFWFEPMVKFILKFTCWLPSVLEFFSASWLVLKLEMSKNCDLPSSFGEANIHLLYVLDSFAFVNWCRYLPGGNDGTKDISNFLLLVSDCRLDILSSA